PARSLQQAGGVAAGRGQRQRRRPHQLRHSEPRVLPLHRGGHEPHVRHSRAGCRRLESRADREGLLPRLHATDACQRHVLGRASRHAARGARPLWAQQRAVQRRPRRLDRRGGELMRALATIGVVWLAITGGAGLGTATAQTAATAPASKGPARPRIRIGANGGVQPSSIAITSSTTTPIYAENETVNATYSVGSGVFFDGGVLVRLAGGLHA